MGAVLYEMTTGRKAFEGQKPGQRDRGDHVLESSTGLIASAHDATRFDHVVRRCLARDPEERWQTALDEKNELLGGYRQLSADADAGAAGSIAVGDSLSPAAAPGFLGDCRQRRSFRWARCDFVEAGMRTELHARRYLLHIYSPEGTVLSPFPQFGGPAVSPTDLASSSPRCATA